MEDKLIRKYDSLVAQLEEPVREIVPAIWRLPFVVDTGFSCSGHILAKSQWPYTRQNFDKQYGWYPHRAILEIAFSLNPELAEIRDQFRAELKAVMVERNGIKISFDDVHTFESKTLPHTNIPGENLREDYNAHVPEDMEKSWESVEFVESLLAEFWEKVAIVVRKYNPEAQIGPIKGKNFRHVINWASWHTVFMNNT